MAQEGNLIKQKVQLLGSTLAGAPWSSLHVSCACTQISRLRIPRTRSGRSAGHLVEPWVAVHSRAFRSACRRLRRVRPRVGTNRSAAGLFFLVGGSLTRELERGSPNRGPDGARVK